MKELIEEYLAEYEQTQGVLPERLDAIGATGYTAAEVGYALFADDAAVREGTLH